MNEFYLPKLAVQYKHNINRRKMHVLRA